MEDRPSWLCKKVSGVLLDISGVLYNSGDGGGRAIAGSVEAVEKLKSTNLKVRFCTNESQCTRQELVNKLSKFGFKLSADELFAPAPAARHIICQRNLRPHLLVYPGCLKEFDGIDQTNPNCVVIGDAADEFSYKNMNSAFRTLISLEKPVLISMGYGKYYMSGGNLTLDVGPFTRALEYACDLKAEIVGKPSKTFFMSALEDIKVPPEEAVMIGDDIVSDIGGAQSCGIRGVQVRTGKYRLQDESHPNVKPDGYVDDLRQAIEMILKFNHVQ